MVDGSLDALKPGQFGIVMGQELAESLGLMVGDKVTVLTPQASVNPAGIMPRFKRFTVVGPIAWEPALVSINRRSLIFTMLKRYFS